MKNTFYLILSIVLSQLTLNVNAQSNFYSNSDIREIKIYFQENNWDHILDSLYSDGNRDRMIGDVQIDGIYYSNVGIRYKGYSSASITRVKNPFNIKLDYVNKTQNHQGITKLKLSNVIHDPSFVREVLSYEIARKYMPASRANFANVYINDTLIGLYSNVESVESEFLNSHFGSSNQAFFKGNPESLNLSGENSNLSNNPGNSNSDYKPYYTAKSKNAEDWTVFYNFIHTLNADLENLDEVLNIDRALWMHAFNYSLINFDSYIGYAQNYYLYRSDNGQFNPILWDLNQSFASFRLTDASVYWQGFSVNEAQTLDPLSHSTNFSVYPRPLMTNLFLNSTYRRMYLAHIRCIMEDNFHNQNYYNRATTLQNLIQESVVNDTNKFYSNEDFMVNIDSTVSDLIEYPGIARLMNNRADYLSTYTGMTGEPTLTNMTNSNNSFGSPITFIAHAEDAKEVVIYYRYSSKEKFTSLELNDSGVNGDLVSGDNSYSILFESSSNFIQYYFYAQNDSAGVFSPKRAAHEFYTISTTIPKGAVMINEFMTENPEASDWIELHNNTNDYISTDSLLLNDTIGTVGGNQLLGNLIAPHEYIILWADGESDKGSTHLNFKLNSEGEFIGLMTLNGKYLDSISFPRQNSIFSYGRYPNGIGQFTDMYPSQHLMNIEPADKVFTSNFYLFPNPTTETLHIQSILELPYQVSIFNVNGTFIDQFEIQTKGSISIDISSYSAGIYTATITKDSYTETQKIIIL